jgi:hypothetical protein
MRRNPAFESKEFIIDRYRREKKPDDRPDGTEIAIWVMVLILVVVMTVARLDEKVEERRAGKAMIGKTSNEKTQGPGRTAPELYLTEYHAGVND